MIAIVIIIMIAAAAAAAVDNIGDSVNNVNCKD